MASDLMTRSVNLENGQNGNRYKMEDLTESTGNDSSTGSCLSESDYDLFSLSRRLSGDSTSKTESRRNVALRRMSTSIGTISINLRNFCRQASTEIANVSPLSSPLSPPGLPPVSTNGVKATLGRLKHRLNFGRDSNELENNGRIEVENVLLIDRFDPKRNISGTLHLTVTHIFFIGANATKEIWIPTKLIHYPERLPLITQGSPIVIRCRHFLNLKFLIPRDRDCQNVFLTVQKLASSDSVDQLPCFQYRPPGLLSVTQGWNFFNLEEEYLRMGVPNKLWVATQINKEYGVCDTYPQLIYVPSVANTPVLIGSSKFRSRGRFPVLSYLHTDGQAALCRCSQPLAGFSARCSEDEAMLQAILKANPGTSSLHVIDTRPMINAAFNRAQGKGYENEAVYKDIQFRFFDIDNIHVMRNSLEKLIKVCEDPTISMSSYLNGVEKSGWLRHVRMILEAANFVAQTISSGQSVLVHCSDGWDRTAQTCSLAQIYLNPHYRTFQGFQALIEKEWLSFGHKFTDRCTLVESVDKQEFSPVFTQFLDCVRQLMTQFPQYFQFNERLLIVLHEEVMAAQFGTFVGNCQKDRLDLKLSARTYSLWGYLALHTEDYINPIYSDEINQGVIKPNLAPQMVTVWRGLYNRWDPLHSNDSQSDLLTSLTECESRLVQHRHFLEARVRQLCNMLGKSPEVTEGKVRGMANADSLYSIKDLDIGSGSHDSSPDANPISRLVPAASSGPVDDPLLALSLSPQTPSSEAPTDAIYWAMESADPPSPNQLFQEMSSVFVDWSSGRMVNSCARCSVGFDFPTRKLTCPSCGCLVCRRCLLAPSLLPGLSVPHQPASLQVSLCSHCTKIVKASLNSVAEESANKGDCLPSAALKQMN